MQNSKGSDNKGRSYRSVEEMWQVQLKDGTWYKKAEEFWEESDVSVDGVLGGFEVLDAPDVQGSTSFIHNVLKGPCSEMKLTRALDVGAGIGRVTKHLLSNFFKKVDLVEGNRKLLMAAPDFVAHACLGALFTTPLQDLTPKPDTYDCVWTQFVIIYLTDDDFVQFLQRCTRSLKQGGVLVIKENILMDNSKVEFEVDCDDSSVTRSDTYLRAIFSRAGLSIVAEQRQSPWPDEMYPVHMYALRSQEPSSPSSSPPQDTPSSTSPPPISQPPPPSSSPPPS